MKNIVAVQKRKLRASLKIAGLPDDAIDAHIIATFGGDLGPKMQAIPRSITKTMLGLFNKYGKGTALVVKLGVTGKLRVYNMPGYKNLQAQGKVIGARPRAKKYSVAA